MGHDRDAAAREDYNADTRSPAALRSPAEP